MLQGEVVMCHSDGSEDEDGEHRVYYMGARRRNLDPMMDSDLEESDDEVEKEAQARMKLLGIGRGRRLN
ncbi:hypothetical protein MTO96_034069 [Rhipicephalus appendiculatus]